ncbi:rRNA maturation RNase YbeY [Mycoplasma bradburyae]|uniref:Endoribonuclease YbeY n=1 Tax=Mycoplasma bradburyae TaxID=2963128 RepID=A0ABT5GCQ5_9MOLU|nr:rRNA maturation RNase YbeY [Mycoplasma bradburyae]MDC4163642.1 rRNA maturation RNase YbeY [Mycoplasma bradburyae]MDC4182250.1 rRNA maturation RNase YbeY [Mycoplasma bradburyae]MDC4184424.1 rRNA maturation RNase YbeY [Mycoplasma bradburyae]UTS70471.1 rRNA maturation RNase YbeY [Mycoplasma bradburyae]UTS71188.1 rRNA maturation RNase YbeY [Mycoplasma bradburyae]
MINHFEVNKIPANLKDDFDDLLKIINKNFSEHFEIKNGLFYELSFVSEAKSLELNTTLRHKEYIADVISVCLWENAEIVSPLLGEIFICSKKISKDAIKYGVGYLYLLIRMIIHGLLHLLEFDHEQSDAYEYVTLTIQDQILDKVIKEVKKKKWKNQELLSLLD